MFGICNVQCLGMLRVVGRIGRGRLVSLVGRAFFMPVVYLSILWRWWCGCCARCGWLIAVGMTEMESVLSFSFWINGLAEMRVDFRYINKTRQV